ncbi:MAG: putative DNA binding domain-containing protein [Fusobacteriaceae bacterium]|jgi:ATP-dependent DNA helicase RecG|nr:putative DNA binding domain-containing protein [Fusobacteriaceae bacterium]
MLTRDLIYLAESIQKHKAETQFLEVKAAHVNCPQRLYDSLSSFSNQDLGGAIIFGLDEKNGFAAIGVYDIQDLQKKVTEQCKQMKPQVRATFTIAQYKDVYICSAEIPGIDAIEKPCYYIALGKSKGSFIRVGEADLPMTDYEIYNYDSYRKHTHDDERTVERATFDMMEQNLIDLYVAKKKMNRPMFSKLTDDKIYEMLNITRNGIPTLSSVLNFSIFPQGFFPQFAVTAIIVPGYEIGDTGYNQERFIDNKRIEGTISDMLNEAMAFCIRNIKVRITIDGNGKRLDRTEYPINAIREIILNALIHRDYGIYTEGTPIQINFFIDRLEIHSPGNLYGKMTIDQLGKSKPDLRNPTLATMMEVLIETENRYSGIPTIIKAMEEARLPPPKFENRRNEFVVTLYNGTQREYGIAEEGVDYISISERSLLKFCCIPRSRKEIAAYLGVSTIFYVTKNYINPLVENGKLALTIPDKPKSTLQKYYTKL